MSAQPSETSGSTGSDAAAPKTGGVRRQWPGVLAGLVIGGIVGGTAAALLPDLMDDAAKAALAERFGVFAVPALILIMLFASWLMLALHEVGHVLGGLAARFRFLFFIAGPLRIEREPRDRLSVGLNRELAMYGGMAALTPTDTVRLRSRLALLVAGGPAASLLAGVMLLMIVPILPPLARMAGALAGAVSIGLFGVTMIPLRSGGMASDGHRLLRLMSRGPGAMRESAVLPLTGMMAGGVAPADWPRDVVTAAIGERDASMEEAVGRMFAYYHFLDLGDDARAGAELDRALALRETFPSALAPSLDLEAAYFAAHVRRDHSTARQLLDRVPARAFGVKPHERDRAVAALALVEGRLEDAASLAAGALDSAPPTAMFSRARLQQLIAESGAAAQPGTHRVHRSA